MPAASPPPPRSLGRYLLFGPIAVGGMAAVHFGRLEGPAGFRRTVAIKRMLQSWAGSPQARTMLVDEARLASRVSHANVVQTLDVVEHGEELFLVLEYVHGTSLDRLLDRARELGQRVAPRVAAGVLAGALRGLHAAHLAKGEDGQPLDLVHRDLSPHNVMVDVDGVARVLDFGVARARGRLQGTRDGQLKGKLAYLAPEQVHGEASRASDVFTAGVVLWECLAGRQLFAGDSEADVLAKVLLCRVPPLAAEGVDAPALQAVLDRALAREPQARFGSAAEMADALDASGSASAAEVAAWVKDVAADELAERARQVEELERWMPSPPAAAPAPATPVAPLRPRARWPLVAGAAAVVALALTWALVPGPEAAGKLRSGGDGTEPDAQAPTDAPASRAGGAGGAPGGSGRPVDGPGAAPISPVAAPGDPAVLPGAASAAAADPAARPPVPGTAGTPRPAGPGTPQAPGDGTGARRGEKPPARKGCDPPYVIDAQGVKRYKVECLK